jgi:hypothetical protein
VRQYGFCNLAVAALRKEASDFSEQTSQLLFGEVFQIVASEAGKCLIETLDDKYVGWIDKKQFIFISDKEMEMISTSPKLYSLSPFSYIKQTYRLNAETTNVPITLGASFIGLSFEIGDFCFSIEDIETTKIMPKTSKSLFSIAKRFLNCPYLWGGKSILGIDCSAFVQMSYKFIGIMLPRDAAMQAFKGDYVENISLADEGDLCFFENSQGKVVHVGIYLGEGQIIHSSGRVRIDNIDTQGIFNVSIGAYTHKLCAIKTFNIRIK